MNHPLSRPHRTHRSDQGFTLIELLIVIAILAVLAAILIPTYTGAQKKPYDAASAQCHKAIFTAETLAKAETGSYIESLDALGPDVREVCQDQGVRVKGAEGGFPSADTASTNTIQIYYGKPLYYTWHPNGSKSYVTSVAEGQKFSPRPF